MPTTQKDQRWVFNQDAESTAAAPGVVRKVLAYCGELMCVENRFEVGAVAAMHSHPHTQIAYIAEGSFEFTVGGETKRVRRGDSLLAPGGVPHGCACLEEGAVLDIFTPMREDFV